MDEFLGQLEQIKIGYTQRGPAFSGKSELFNEVTQPLILKTADFLAISKNQEAGVNSKLLKEKVDELEKERVRMKTEHGEDRRTLEMKVQILE